MLETTLAWVRFLAPIWLPTVVVVLMWRAWSKPGEFQLTAGEKIIRLGIILVALVVLAWLFGHLVLGVNTMPWWD
jgi:hypothetical protein